MKKLIALLLSVTMLACMFAGCSKSNSNGEAAPTETDKTEQSQGSDAADTIDYSNITIGLMLMSTITDGAWSQAVGESLQRLQKELNLSDDQVYIVENVPEGGAECDSTIRQLVDEGCNIIFGSSSSFLTSINAAYPLYPDVYFAQFEGTNEANCCAYTIWDIEGMFMCGYAGALMSKTDELGFVGNQPQSSIIRAIDAYAAGARAANPNATVRVLWSNSWYDLAMDRQCAESLMQLGITVIGNVSTVAVLQACQEGGAYTNGYYVDLHDYAPKATLTSFVWNFAPTMKKVVDQVATDTWTAETKYANMSEGAAILADWNTDIMPQDVIDKCNEMYQKIVDGSYTVMEGPLYDNKGNEVLADGKTFTLDELTVCYFLLDNVIGEIP